MHVKSEDVEMCGLRMASGNCLTKSGIAAHSCFDASNRIVILVCAALKEVWQKIWRNSYRTFAQKLRLMVFCFFFCPRTT